MLLNYHELTMDEPKNSPQKKKQFRVICFVMASSIVYSLISSGALRPVEVTLGEFPGGEFIYKTTGRDYAASMSLLDSIAKEVGIKESKHGSIMYNLYLDDPLAVNGRKQRFATGILLNDDTIAKGHPKEETSRKLLEEINPTISKKPLTPTELEELAAYDLWPRLHYHSATLPPVKAAVVEYTFSNGFVSALLHSYKVFPTIRRYAKEQHGVSESVPVVLTTCYISENKCFHYVPLSDPENVFRLGKDQWDPKKDGGGHVDWKGVRKMILKVVSLGQLGEDQEYVVTTEQEDAVPPPPKADNKMKEKEKTTTINKEDEEPPATEEEAVTEQPPAEEASSSENIKEKNQEEFEATIGEGAPVEEEEVQAAEPTTETTTEDTTEEEPPQEDQQQQQDETTTTPEEEETEQKAEEVTEESPSGGESAAANDHDTAHETRPEEPVEHDTQQHTADGVHDSPPIQDDESPPQRDEL